MNKQEKIILYLSIAVILLFSSLLYLQITTTREIRSSISSLEKNMQTREQKLRSEISDSFSDVSDNLASINKNMIESDDILATGLTNLKKESETNVKLLSDFIKGVEEQSQIQLENIKSDVDSISSEVDNIKIESKDFTLIIEDVLPAVVSIRTDQGLGSGVFITSDGFIATNYHVIQSASYIQVRTYSGQTFTASLVGASTEDDIAILKIEAQTPYMEFASSTQTGEHVIAMGNPKGLDFSVTEGIISAAARRINGIDYIQTDVPLNPGNSGGPLVNIKKEIVGLNNFKIGESESLGFAIPASLVEEISEEIITQFNS